MRIIVVTLLFTLAVCPQFIESYQERRGREPRVGTGFNMAAPPASGLRNDRTYRRIRLPQGFLYKDNGCFRRLAGDVAVATSQDGLILGAIINGSVRLLYNAQRQMVLLREADHYQFPINLEIARQLGVYGPLPPENLRPNLHCE